MKAFIFCAAVVLGSPFIQGNALEAKDFLTLKNSRPLQAESTMAAMEPWETPISGFFIRTHQEIPVIEHAENLDSWVFEIDGLVAKPQRLNLRDLKAFKYKELHAVLECAGNGRGRHVPNVPGVQWEKGAAGNAGWSGVSLAEVLKRAGVKTGAKFARVEGADVPTMASVPRFIRSIPLEKINEASTLLAWEMNQEPIPVLHGGPLRLILPGWYGQNWIKWVKKITITAEEDPGFYMKKAYRMPKEPVKPGEKWDSATGVPVQTILVQSFIVAPLKDDVVVQAKPFQVRGKAFSGFGTIEAVDLSIDDGVTWKPAKLEAPHASGGWQEFSLDVVATKVGPFKIISRARDRAGNTQPLKPEWNPSGYLFNAVDEVQVSVVETQPLLTGSGLFEERCLTCHSTEIVTGQKLNQAGWEKVLAKMVSFGADVKDNEKSILIEYLIALTQKNPRELNVNFFDREAAFSEGAAHIGKRGVVTNIQRGAELFKTNCASCHGANAEGGLGPRLKGRAIPTAELLMVVHQGLGRMPALASAFETTRGSHKTPQSLIELQAFLHK